MDILSSPKARKMRRKGASYRDIATAGAVSMTRIRKARKLPKDDDPTRIPTPEHKARRELRREIRQAGGLKPWWG